MEDILTYVIVFGFGIGLAGLYFYRKDKKRLLPVSVQHYAGLEMIVQIEKEKSELTHITIRLVQAPNTPPPASLKLEMIDADRNKRLIDLTSIATIKDITDKNYPSHAIRELVLPFTKMSASMKTENFSYTSFRFVVENPSGNKFKSHELVYDDRWKLYKLDSGLYN
jgi:hypothetical protein